MERLDRLERLTDLLLVLLDTSRPLSLAEIAQAVPGYPEGHDARRQAFERDKRLLRAEGIVIQVEPISAKEQLGYRIDPDDYYLPELDLDPEEQAALNLAVAAVHLGDPDGRQALAKLGADEGGAAFHRGEEAAVAALPALPALPVLFEAIRLRAPVEFPYRGGARRVEPAGLRFRGGRWYLVGWDRDREAPRTFRVDRMEGTPVPGEPGTATHAESLDAEAVVPAEPWKAGEGEVELVDLVVDGIEAWRVVGEVGVDAVVERRPDGSVVLRLPVTNVAAFRSWVLGLLDHAEVLGPPAVRDDVVAWLSRVAAAGAGTAGTTTAATGTARAGGPAGGGDAGDSATTGGAR